jgi:hypothetical protein
MLKKRCIVFLVAFFVTGHLFAQSVPVFEPAKSPDSIKAFRINGTINIDGLLNDVYWNDIPFISKFKEVEPIQGTISRVQTRVKIAYNDKYLYFGVICMDSLGKKGTRIQNLARDFDLHENDMFGVALDPFSMKRNSLAFQTTPYGAQSDLQTFDDLLEDRDWDALWKVRTSRNDSGWTAEFEIPFKTLRYPDTSSSWRINFVRTVRRVYNISAYPGYPRAYSPYRMPYTAILTGLKVPPSPNNIRVNPYALIQQNRQTFTKNGKDSVVNSLKTRAGADLKWALSPHSVLDLTYNTDFAQAEVDRQVINLQRFTIFFPERRQFFLENSGLFKAGQDGLIQPFFSRRIGLDDFGNTIPVEGGARFTSRNIKSSTGALIMRQRKTDVSPASNFGVIRHQRNYGEQNNVGILFTGRVDEKLNDIKTPANYTATLNGFNRFNQKWAVNYMVSGSFDDKNGMAGYFNLQHITDKINYSSQHGIIGENYNPRVGFVSSSNIIFHNTGGYATLRPKWRPKSVRRLDPGFILNVYQYANDFSFREAALDISPIWIWFNNRSRITYTYQPNWQNLRDNFSPLGMKILAGKYQFNRHIASYRSDQSRKLSTIISASTGGYYDGNLHNIIFRGRYAPIPHISVELRYEHNKFTELGALKENKKTDLYSINSRFALNPRLSANMFYQYNTFTKTSNVNFRVSWEYMPLSYIYLVYNSIDNNNIYRLDQQAIAKVTFLKQF